MFSGSEVRESDTERSWEKTKPSQTPNYHTVQVPNSVCHIHVVFLKQKQPPFTDNCFSKLIDETNNFKNVNPLSSFQSIAFRIEICEKSVILCFVFLSLVSPLSSIIGYLRKVKSLSLPFAGSQGGETWTNSAGMPHGVHRPWFTEEATEFQLEETLWPRSPNLRGQSEIQLQIRFLNPHPVSFFKYLKFSSKISYKGFVGIRQFFCQVSAVRITVASTSILPHVELSVSEKSGDK